VNRSEQRSTRGADAERQSGRVLRWLRAASVAFALGVLAAGCGSEARHTTTAASDRDAGAPPSAAAMAPPLTDYSPCSDWVHASRGYQVSYAATITDTPHDTGALAYIVNYECDKVTEYPVPPDPSTSSIGVIAEQFDQPALLASVVVCDRNAGRYYVPEFCRLASSQ
jgi:hypothetical protein